MEIENDILKKQVSDLKRQNQYLKECIEEVAMENSKLLEERNKKKQKSPKWLFFHEHKEFVSREYNIPMKCWNVLKRITDDMYDEFEESCK